MPRLLQDWLTEQADTRPDAIAIVSGGEQLTFADLEKQTTQLARMLKESGCQQGDRIALPVSKNPLSIVGLLGVYKADGVCVPLDPLSPPHRLGKILSSCEADWLLGEPSVANSLAGLLAQDVWEGRIGWLAPADTAETLPIAFSSNDTKSLPDSTLVSRNGSESPAHILFTSGSTGVPKGVVITHGNVVGFVDWAVRYFGLEAGDRLSAHAPLHFDIAFLDVFGALAAGAQLHLVPRELNLLPNKMGEFIRASQLTQWFSAPSILNYLAHFDVVAAGDFPSLKRVIWCGEVLPTPALIYWMERLPHAAFTNLYGPTETTIASSYYTVPECPSDPRAAIPIGLPCDGEELLVLDSALRAVPQGETGDLYIAGTGVTPGYWRDPARTDAAFIEHPDRPGVRLYRTGDLARIDPDGLVYFLGRIDSQIKCRGYRIELGEIEAALNALDAVGDCAVVALRSQGFEGTSICCAYVATESGLTPARLRQTLGQVLPSYMLPARWMPMDRLPNNASGKIDRPRLTQLFAGQLEEQTETVQTADA